MAARPMMKGHGTENDFIVVDDRAAEFDLTDAAVQALCDRRAGVGADGILRVVRTDHADEAAVRAQASQAPFFMDYRNADGSRAEMCGNGARVFARYLQHAGLINPAGTAPVWIATRGGPRPVTIRGAEISVDLGRAQQRPARPVVSVLLGPDREFEAQGWTVEMPNPHVVVPVPDADTLAGLRLIDAPDVQPSRPDGQNVEFVQLVGDRHLALRVHERGSGETRSCGTGIAAAVVAVASAAKTPAEPAATGRWQVDVPGGRCWIEFTETGSVVLTGPAVLVAEVTPTAEWWRVHGG